MMYITKQAEPMDYMRYRCTIDACFDDMDSVAKTALKTSLLKEQGYLCAYCMSKISLRNMKVEHYVSRKHIEELAKLEHNPSRSDLDDLVYSNLLAVCLGNAGKRGDKRKTTDLTCDSQKGDKPLTINPQNQSHMQTIKYKTDGTILSVNPEFDTEINEVLNLNYEYGYLLNARATTLREFKRIILEQKNPGRKIGKEKLIKILNGYTNQSNTTEIKPYVGIIISYLKEKIAKM